MGGWNQIVIFNFTTKQMSKKITFANTTLIRISNHHLQCQVWRLFFFLFFFFSQRQQTSLNRNWWSSWSWWRTHTWSASEREQKCCKNSWTDCHFEFCSYVALFVGKKQLFRLKCTLCWIFSCPSSSLFLLFTPDFFARFFCCLCLFFCPFQCLAFFWFSVPPWRAYFFLPVAECLKGVVPFRFSCLLKAALSTTTTTTAATTTYA